MRENKRHIKFTKGARSSFTSLSKGEQSKTIQFLEVLSEDFQSTSLSTRIYKLSGTEKPLYALRLNQKLRIILELSDEKILVLDILNHDLFIKYFKN